MHGKDFKPDPGTLPHLRWSSLQQLVSVKTCKGLQLIGLQPIDSILHVAAVTQPSLQTKLKTDENGHALKVAPDTLSCFVDIFYIFTKMLITFCFTNILFQFKN